MKNSRVHKMVAVAMLAAIAFVLQMISFPVIPAFSFMKVDFSDIPVMIGMFLYGPVTGITTAFVRSLVHLLATGFSPDNLVGDIASFFATTLFTMPMYYFFRHGGSQLKNKILGVGTGIISMTTFMSIANYFVITPLYLKVLGLDAMQMLGMPLMNYVLIGVVPFNLIKGGIVSAVFLVLHAKLLPWLRKKQGFIGQTKTLTK